MQTETFRSVKSVPTIVRIIISQATRLRAQRGISQVVFDQQIQRIAREELEPKGLSLVVRELPSGRMRFLIKEKATGAVCEMLDFAADGSPEREGPEAPDGMS